jgi:hypothetical protein
MCIKAGELVPAGGDAVAGESCAVAATAWSNAVARIARRIMSAPGAREPKINP